jgi:hypothetical protein
MGDWRRTYAKHLDSGPGRSKPPRRRPTVREWSLAVIAAGLALGGGAAFALVFSGLGQARVPTVALPPAAHSTSGAPSLPATAPASSAPARPHKHRHRHHRAPATMMPAPAEVPAPVATYYTPESQAADPPEDASWDPPPASPPTHTVAPTPTHPYSPDPVPSSPPAPTPTYTASASASVTATASPPGY